MALLVDYLSHYLSPFISIRLRAQFQQDPELRCALSTFLVSVGFGISAALLFSVFSTKFWIACSVFLAMTYWKSPDWHHGYRLALQAAALGLAFGSALMSMLLWCSHPGALFFRYVLVFATFHFSEYVFTAVTNRRSLKNDSFLLNHSTAYWIAATASWVEFLVEVWLVPGIKNPTVSWFGLLMCLCGEIIRKLAMVHAGVGFTHKLALSKRSDHHLVTEGIYSWCRHPGYAGWFIWSISTQLVLCNPVCTIAYTLASYSFFEERICEEEKDLLQFFGHAYTSYQERVPLTGVPFVKGYFSNRR